MFHLLDRHWLLTSTTYGTWLPGDERGFVSPVHDDDGVLVLHNQIGTEYDADVLLLKEHAQRQLLGPPVYFDSGHAELIHAQFVETCERRKWLLVADAVMRNHFHAVVSVPGDPKPETLLRDLKSYASGRLNRNHPRPQSGTWWTESGSRRKLPIENAVRGAVHYVWHQPGFLTRFVHPEVPADWYA